MAMEAVLRQRLSRFRGAKQQYVIDFLPCVMTLARACKSG
jgi:hypothetical protein